MGRVLRLACGFMGVVVLLTTAGMAWARRDDSAWMLLRSRGLILVDPNTGLQIPLTRSYSSALWFHAYSDKTGWLYYVGVDYVPSATGMGGLYRVRLDGENESELIIADPNIIHVELSHDERWIIYIVKEMVSNQESHYTLFRARADGRDILQLTDTLANGAPFDSMGASPYFSLDDEWVIFTGHYAGQSEAVVFRIHLDGTKLEEVITGASTNTGYLEARNFSWIFLNRGGSIYSYDVNREPPLVLMDQWIGGQRLLQYVGWLPRSKVAMFSSSEVGVGGLKILGLRPDGAQVWAVDGGYLYGVNADESWIFIGGIHGIERMRPDGSQRESLVDGSLGVLNAMFARDEWVLFEVSNASSPGTTIYRMHLDGTHFGTVADSPPDGNVRLFNWHSDYDFVICATISTSGPGIFLHRMNLDGSHSKILTEGLYEPYFETWLPPIDRGWTPSHLGIIGAGLIGIFIIRPKKWWGNKH